MIRHIPSLVPSVPIVSMGTHRLVCDGLRLWPPVEDCLDWYRQIHPGFCGSGHVWGPVICHIHVPIVALYMYLQNMYVLYRWVQYQWASEESHTCTCSLHYLHMYVNVNCSLLMERQRLVCDGPRLCQPVDDFLDWFIVLHCHSTTHPC